MRAVVRIVYFGTTGPLLLLRPLVLRNWLILRLLLLLLFQRFEWRSRPLRLILGIGSARVLLLLRARVRMILVHRATRYYAL